MRSHRHLRNSFTLVAGLTALFLLVHCAVPERDYSLLGAGDNGGAGSSGEAGMSGSSGDSGSGSGGSAGAGGNDSDGGTGGQDAGSDADASSGNGGASGAAGASGAGGSTGNDDCDAAQVCVPRIPPDWQGPLAVNTTGASDCLGEYTTPHGVFHADLQAPAATCSCGCVLSGVSCYLESDFTGAPFDPIGTCANAPSDDDILTARTSAACTPQPYSTVPALTWQSSARTCGGASEGRSCSRGACYADPGAFGEVCISRAGDFACPSDFPARTLYFGDVSDNRSCGACSCFPTGQECEIELRICSVGVFDVTLNSAEENSYQLNSSDGDTVTFLSSKVLDQGSCTSSGSTPQGSATPTNPLTVCCMQ